MEGLTKINLTDDALKNIFIMAPLLDEAGQNKVFGLMCGLLANTSGKSNKPLIGKTKPTDGRKAG